MIVGISLGLNVPFMLPVIFAGVITTNVHNQYILIPCVFRYHECFSSRLFMLIGVHLDLSSLLSATTMIIAGIY